MIRDSLGAPIYAYRKTTAGRNPRAEPEHDFHKQIAQYLAFALPPEIEWTYTLNGVHLGHSQRQKAVDAGLRRGLGDYVLLVPVKATFTACMIEAKDAKRGRLSDEQKRWAAKMGAKWATVETLEDVEAAIVGWGITPKCSVSAANRYGAVTAP